MVFNKFWTKEDNFLYRKLIKEGKDDNYIKDYFSMDKLFYHPTKKYTKGKSASIPTFKIKINDFSGFINEIKYTELKTDFIIDWEKSKIFTDEFNYNYIFQTNSGNKYIIEFIYIKDTIGPFPNKNIYNISFTLLTNRNLDNYIEYEQKTYLNEQHELMKRIIFIFNDFNNRFGNNCIYLLGETEDIKKINWYRNLIKNSFDNITEMEGVSSFTNGLSAYYFKIN